MSAFDDWLGQLKASGKGPVTLYTCTRGRAFEYPFALAGDWTGATIRGQVRTAPDAAGDPIVTFTTSGPTVLGSFSVFTISLAAGTGVNSTGILPAAATGDGSAEFAFDLLITPDGGDETLLFGGVLPVIGRITA